MYIYIYMYICIYQVVADFPQDFRSMGLEGAATQVRGSGSGQSVFDSLHPITSITEFCVESMGELVDIKKGQS